MADIFGEVRSLINFVAGRAKKNIFSTTSKIKDRISQSLDGKQIAF
jgi:hypothetical protein